MSQHVTQFQTSISEDPMHIVPITLAALKDNIIRQDQVKKWKKTAEILASSRRNNGKIKKHAS